MRSLGGAVDAGAETGARCGAAADADDGTAAARGLSTAYAHLRGPVAEMLMRLALVKPDQGNIEATLRRLKQAEEARPRYAAPRLSDISCAAAREE